MTQPAKSQEPSMEEILASIRRIIADDDVNKTVQRAPEPPRVEPPPPLPPQPSYSAPPVAPTSSRFAQSMADEPSAADPASDILDLTESMAATMPQPSAVNVPPNSAAQFRTIDGSSDVGFDETPERPAPPAAEERGVL